MSRAPRRRELPSGSVLVELDVTARCECGASSVPVVWFDPGARADSLRAGDAVLVVGQVRRRFFRAGTTTQSRTEVVAQRVVAGSRRAHVTRALADVAAAVSGRA